MGINHNWGQGTKRCGKEFSLEFCKSTFFCSLLLVVCLLFLASSKGMFPFFCSRKNQDVLREGLLFFSVFICPCIWICFERSTSVFQFFCLFLSLAASAAVIEGSWRNHQAASSNNKSHHLLQTSENKKNIRKKQRKPENLYLFIKFSKKLKCYQNKLIFNTN